MSLSSVDWAALKEEFQFTTARSGGSGGQHVNKVETKVILKFHLQNSRVLNDEQKAQIAGVLNKRIDKTGLISMYCQATRSQLKNKARVIDNFISLLRRSLVVQKPRKKTRISAAKKNEIRAAKKHRASVKRMRKKPSQYD